MTHRVWLPFVDVDAATRALGPLPTGIEADCFLGRGDEPASIAEMDLLVAPYMVPAPAVLARVDEMVGLRAILVQLAGYDNFLPLLPPGVQLCNAAGVHDASTAELAVGLTLANNRHLDRYARLMESGTWGADTSVSLADRRVLILGYGHIGRAIAARLEPFEVSITRVASKARIEDGHEVHGVDELHALLPQTDVLILITPLTPQTRHLIGGYELALLPDDALVVNMCRGPVVDTDALVAATASGRIRASLDVTDPEPLPPDHPLWRTPGVLISPHVGGQSSAFPPRTNKLIAAQLRRWAAGEPLANIVAVG